MQLFRSLFFLALLVPLGAPLAVSLTAYDGQSDPRAAIAEQDLAVQDIDPAPATLAELVAARAAHVDQLAADNQAHCLAQVVYFEARSESLEGQLAVAQVVLNRVETPRYPATICAVAFQNEHLPFRCQFSFACDGMPDKPYNKTAWRQAQAVAQLALDGAWQDITGQSTHYHALNAMPYWRNHLQQTVQLGRHIFYREDRS